MTKSFLPYLFLSSLTVSSMFTLLYALCAHTHSVHVCAHVCTCACMYREKKLMCPFASYVLDHGLTEPGVCHFIQTSKPPGSVSFHSLGTAGVTGMHDPGHLCGCWGSELGSSGLCSKPFTHWAISRLPHPATSCTVMFGNDKWP